MKFRSAALTATLVLASIPMLAQQQPAAKPQGPQPKNQQELEALQKVQAAQQAGNPDQELAAISNVLENFTNTDFKPQLLAMALVAATQKNDYTVISTWTDRALQADPNDIQAHITLAEATAQHTRENDLDKPQSVKKIQDNSNKALDLLKTATAGPAGIPPEKWPDYKKQLTSQAYDALGQAAALEKKYPDSIAAYKSALEADPASPVPPARLAKVYVDSKQYDDAIATADKVLAMNDAPPAVKQFAQQQKDAATKLKGGTK
jgi:tetratricopeptide (TPR) repeat protein